MQVNNVDNINAVWINDILFPVFDCLFVFGSNLELPPKLSFSLAHNLWIRPTSPQFAFPRTIYFLLSPRYMSNAQNSPLTFLCIFIEFYPTWFSHFPFYFAPTSQMNDKILDFPESYEGKLSGFKPNLSFSVVPINPFCTMYNVSDNRPGEELQSLPKKDRVADPFVNNTIFHQCSLF